MARGATNHAYAFEKYVKVADTINTTTSEPMAVPLRQADGRVVPRRLGDAS